MPRQRWRNDVRDELRSMRGEFGEFRHEIGEMRNELRGVRDELGEVTVELREDLSDDIRAQRDGLLTVLDEIRRHHNGSQDPD
jgi:uncharacterized coiled-coil DUF342 family protein